MGSWHTTVLRFVYRYNRTVEPNSIGGIVFPGPGTHRTAGQEPYGTLTIARLCASHQCCALARMEQWVLLGIPARQDASMQRACHDKPAYSTSSSHSYTMLKVQGALPMTRWVIRDAALCSLLQRLNGNAVHYSVRNDQDCEEDVFPLFICVDMRLVQCREGLSQSTAS